MANIVSIQSCSPKNSTWRIDVMDGHKLEPALLAPVRLSPRPSRSLDFGIVSETNGLGLVVRKVDNAIHRINRYPADSVVCFVNTYLLDSDLSGG